MPLSLYKFIIVGRKPTKFGTHSIKPHSSFNGTTLCKTRIINDLLKLNLNRMCMRDKSYVCSYIEPPLSRLSIILKILIHDIIEFHQSEIFA